MGVKTRPKWGRSHPVNISQNVGEDFEYVRVDLPEPRDFTIMIGNPSESLFSFQQTAAVGDDPLCWSFASYFTISATVGGTNTIIQAISPVLGTVSHVVAQSLVVRAQVPGLDGSPGPAWNKTRFAIGAGPGRPTEHRYVKDYPVGLTPTYIHLHPWVHSVQLTAANATDLTGVSVEEAIHYPHGVISDGGVPKTRPFSAFSVPVPLRYDTNVLKLTASGGTVSTVLLTQFYLL